MTRPDHLAAEAIAMAGKPWQPVGCERCGGTSNLLLDRDHERLLACEECGYVFSIVRCPTCAQRMTYGGDFGAPGVGQHYHCPSDHHWSKMAENLFPLESMAHVMDAEDIR